MTIPGLLQERQNVFPGPSEAHQHLNININSIYLLYMIIEFK